MKPRKRQQTPIDTDGNGAPEDDSHPLIVPRSDKTLLPMAPERVRRLRQHLVESLRALRAEAKPDPTASPLLPDLTGFTARVAQAACTLCKGWCCKDGGEHAYLDERILARVSHAAPGLGARAILRLYLDRVPTHGYEGSCIFHGSQGCTLDRSQRSDICNNYFCGGLGAYVTSDEPEKPVIVFAGDGAAMRKSPILRP